MPCSASVPIVTFQGKKIRIFTVYIKIYVGALCFRLCGEGRTLVMTPKALGLLQEAKGNDSKGPICTQREEKRRTFSREISFSCLDFF